MPPQIPEGGDRWDPGTKVGPEVVSELFPGVRLSAKREALLAGELDAYAVQVGDGSGIGTLEYLLVVPPRAITIRSSARDLGMALSARICLAHGARRKASFVMLNGQPCGMLQGWRCGMPSPPARVL